MKKPVSQPRHEELKRMLEGRRLDIQHEVHNRMRTVRGEGTAAVRRVEPGGVEAAMQEDLELDLIQIHAEMIDRITEAIARVDQGDYGTCRDCGEDIAAKRLRALPFATLCRECQEVFETSERRARHLARRPAIFAANGVLSDDR